MLRRLVWVRNVSVISENVTAITTKKTAMLTTPPLSWMISLARSRIALGGCGRGQECAPLSGRVPADDRAEFSAHDEVDDLLDIRLANEPLGRVAPLVENHDPVADHEQILQPVGDENDADALGAHAPDEIEHSVDLGDRERGRRLVHDEDQGSNDTARPIAML